MRRKFIIICCALMAAMVGTDVTAQSLAQGLAQNIVQNTAQGPAQSLSCDVLPLHRRRTPPHDHALRRAKAEQDKGPGGSFYKGERHQLIVLAAFADQDFQGDSAATVSQWNKICNTEHLQEAPFCGSVHDYFMAQSYGQLSLVFDLQFIRVGNRSRYRSTEDDDENSQYLMLDVVDSLMNRAIDWSLYDWNGDGYVNQIIIIFAGKGSGYGGFGGGYDAIWPHQWYLTWHQVDRQKGVYYQPREVNYNDKTYYLDSYCATQELWSNGTYGTIGTLCHEYTHCFGLPDVYAYDHNETPGGWDLMDSGCYNRGGFYPVSYSAHERWLMGWLTPEELTTPTVVTDMPALEDEPRAYIIRNDGYPNEFYLLENRQPRGWDAPLPDSGLVVFHIDYSPSTWLYMDVNGNDRHYVIIGANDTLSNKYSSNWAYPNDDNNALTNTSHPAATLWHANTDGTMLMSKPITDITQTDGLVSFRFLSEPTGLPQPADSKQPRKIIRDGQLLILRDGKTYTIL